MYHFFCSNFQMPCAIYKVHVGWSAQHDRPWNPRSPSSTLGASDVPELDVSYVETFHNLWLTLKSKYATWSMVRVIKEHCFTMFHLVTGTVGTDPPHIYLDLIWLNVPISWTKLVLFWWGDDDLISKMNSSFDLYWLMKYDNPINHPKLPTCRKDGIPRWRCHFAFFSEACEQLVGLCKDEVGRG